MPDLDDEIYLPSSDTWKRFADRTKEDLGEIVGILMERRGALH